MKRIIMKTKDGEIEIEAHGFKGQSCDSATEFLRRNLGDEIATELKPTYYETEEGEVVNKYKPICG